MMRALYTLLVWLLQPLLRWKLARRGQKEPGYLLAPQERFGHYGFAPDRPRGGARQLIWVHAVSLGETRVAAILVAALRAQWPGMRLLLTHSTATGRAEGLRLLRPGDRQAWLPWDTPGAVNRFLDQFAPRLGVLLETELWPNLMAACQQRRIPVALVNARLNQRSLRRALWLAPLARPAYASLSLVLAQTEADAARLRQLGCKVDAVPGNLKFDAAPDPAQLRRGQGWRRRSERPVLMFASSREGEEKLWLDAIEAAGQRGAASGAGAAPRWLLVPRHPQRFEEVAKLVRARGLSLSRCSGWLDGPDAQALGCEVWLGDSLGDMALYYGLSDLALLGGSFAPLGGHNLIEAAACGCPIVIGPHVYNFADAAEQAVAQGAALRAGTMHQAVLALHRLLRDETARRAAVLACAAFSDAHRGCAQRSAAALAALFLPGGVARQPRA